MDQKIIQELNDFTNQAMRDAMSDYTDLRAHYPLDLPFAGGIEMPRRVTGEKRDGTGKAGFPQCGAGTMGSCLSSRPRP